MSNDLKSSKLAQNLFQVIITKFFVVLRSITTLLIGLSFADSLLRQLVFTRDKSMKVSMGQPNDLLLDDLELVLREIDEFNIAISSNKPMDVSQSLENYLQYVAKSGNTVFPWPHVRNLFRSKMVNAIQQFQEPACPNESFVLERFDLFRLAAPFTVQRLTELILQPTRHYRKKEKFLRGLEKTVLVVSTIEPHSLNSDEEKNGNDTNNTSASSCDAEMETVTFNRTFSLERSDLTATVRPSAIEVMNQLNSEDIVLDTTSAVIGSAVDVISQSISVSGALISEDVGVTTSVVSSVDIITPDIAIAVSSEGIMIDPVSEVAATSVVSMEADDDTAMECESSTPVTEVTSVSLLQCVAEQDVVVSTATPLTTPGALSTTESVLEGVSSSLVNMESVKLPMEDEPSSLECEPQPPVDQTPSLFHCVATNPVEVPSVVTPTPLQPTEAPLNETLVDQNVLSTDPAEAVLVSLPTELETVVKSQEIEVHEEANKLVVESPTSEPSKTDTLQAVQDPATSIPLIVEATPEQLAVVEPVDVDLASAESAQDEKIEEQIIVSSQPVEETLEGVVAKDPIQPEAVAPETSSEAKVSEEPSNVEGTE